MCFPQRAGSTFFILGDEKGYFLEKRHEVDLKLTQVGPRLAPRRLRSISLEPASVWRGRDPQRESDRESTGSQQGAHFRGPRPLGNAKIKRLLNPNNPTQAWARAQSKDLTRPGHKARRIFLSVLLISFVFGWFFADLHCCCMVFD